MLVEAIRDESEGARVARYAAEERRGMVEECLAGGLTTRERCQTYGLLGATMSRWVPARGMGQEEGCGEGFVFAEVAVLATHAGTTRRSLSSSQVSVSPCPPATGEIDVRTPFTVCRPRGSYSYDSEVSGTPELMVSVGQLES